MGLLETTSLCCGASTLTDACSNGIHLSGDEVASTLTTTISTATTSGGPHVYVYASTARDYVESMSDEELNNLVDEVDIALEEIDPPKVKKL